jgi:hypothetical protein
MKSTLRICLLAAVVIILAFPLNAYAAPGTWEKIGGPGFQFVCAGNDLYGLLPISRASIITTVSQIPGRK